MRNDLATGMLLIALPVAFNAAFATLAATFDYPDILRRPTAEVLTRFREGGVRLVVTWWIFALTAVLLAPTAVLLAATLEGDATLVEVGATVGVLASVVQFVGLIRWPFLVPFLARLAADPDSSAATLSAVDVVFQSFNRFLGVGVGEHLGYLFTGSWTVLVGVAILTDGPVWLGVAGLAIGVLLGLCSLEFVGPFERGGWSLAAAVTPFAYVAWSLWLVATGVVLLV